MLGVGTHQHVSGTWASVERASSGDGRDQQRLAGIGRGLHNSKGISRRREESAGVGVRRGRCRVSGGGHDKRAQPINAACSFNFILCLFLLLIGRHVYIMLTIPS